MIIFLSGIDSDGEKTKKIRKRYRECRQTPVTVIECTAETLPAHLQNSLSYFDAIFCVRSLHFLEDVELVMANVRSLLPPGSPFVVINFPICELYFDPSCSDRELNDIFIEFYSQTFGPDLESYWTARVQGPKPKFYIN